MPTPPPLPPDLSELWKAWRTALLADTLIMQLINQDAQGGSIYLEMPHNKVPFPLLVLKIPTADINTNASYLDVFRPTLQMNYYSLDRWSGSKIFAALQANWSIPKLRGQFESDNFVMSQMIWSHPIDIGKLRISNDDQDIWGFACTADCFVKRL